FETAAAGRRMEYLFRRPERDQRVDQRLLRAQVGGLFAGSAIHAQSAREHPASWRYSPHEHLQQIVSRAPGSVSVEIFADNSGGNDFAAELRAVLHLQNVVLEPGDVDSTRDHKSFQTDAFVARQQTIARALSAQH